MKGPSLPLPPWRKWLYRVLGALFIVGSVLASPRVVVIVSTAQQAWSKGGVSDEALAQILGYATGTVVATLALFAGGIWLLVRSWRRTGHAAESEVTQATPVRAAQAATVRQGRQMKSRFSSCNVL